MTNIPSKIKYLREQAELSQNQLARQSGVSVGFISKLEAGQYQTISLDKCQQIAKGLNVTLKYLLESIGLLKGSGTPNATLMLKSALRGDGYTASEAMRVIEYGEYIKKSRNTNN